MANYSEKKVSKRLHHIVILYSAIGILVVGLTVAFAGIAPLYERLKKEQEHKLLFAVHTRTQSIQQYLSRVKDITLQVTSRTKARLELEAYGRNEISFKQAHTFTNKVLTDAIKRSNDLLSLTRLTNSGLTLGQVGIPIPKKYLSTVSTTLEQVEVRGPYTIGDKAVLLVAAPIPGSQSNNVGIDIALFNLNSLKAIVQDYTGLGDSGEILLAKQVQENFKLLFNPQRSNDNKIDLAKDSPLTRVFSLAVNNRQPGTTMTTHNAIPMALAYAKIEGIDWRIVMKMAQDELYATIDSQVSNVVFVIGLLIFAGTAGMIFLLRPLSGRIMLHTSELESAIKDKTTDLQHELDEHKKTADQLRATSAALAQKADQLSVVNKELDQFAYVTSHDLKAPLRAIGNLTSWIEEDLGDELPEDTSKNMDLLRTRVKRMELLIDAILQYSRAGKVNTEPETVDCCELLDEIIDCLNPPPNVSVVVLGPVPTIETRRIALHQVLVNLVSNAVKHNSNAEGNVTISCRDCGDLYEFTVSDDGPGIAPKHQDLIFKMFQTLKPTANTDNTGIGLTIAKKMVESQGGSLTLVSNSGEGACFSFTWPKSIEVRASA